MDDDKLHHEKEEFGLHARIDKEIKELLLLEGKVLQIPEEFIVETDESFQAEAEYHEEKKLSLYQMLQNMTVSQKVALAMKGNKEARGLLIRDSNKLVACAVMRNPRITENEVLGAANSRNIKEEVIRLIIENKEWMKTYPMKLAVVQNPKTPLGVSMKFLGYIYDKDLKMLSQSKNIPSALVTAARRTMAQREKK